MTGLATRAQEYGAGSLADKCDHSQVLGDDSDTEAVLPAAAPKPIPIRYSPGEPTDADRESAKQLRAMKGLDLGSIARTSAAVRARGTCRHLTVRRTVSVQRYTRYNPACMTRGDPHAEDSRAT
ncbi:hypothetical protein EXIGLDRAFT_836534 [Exidia glandulosa HHB12029]|uniref:Uncharacterized protein n=1 Tax=Exidia glandulosa HHB12029 TaxID=1314781 RepID=A0A165HR53_EXIGL|nr:hypothetical protein EXIGLDRAFT_836534 [Exidia glandulosa HHB12029]